MNHVNMGVTRIIIDGNTYHSNLLPLFEAGTTHTVIIEMG
jgi:hypothetical protein